MGSTLATAGLVPVVLELNTAAGAVAAVMIHSRNEDEEAAARTILAGLGISISPRPALLPRAHRLTVVDGGRSGRKTACRWPVGGNGIGKPPGLERR